MGGHLDEWGNHVASYPIFAQSSRFDPPYPEQHPRPNGMQAYQEYVDKSL